MNITDLRTGVVVQLGTTLLQVSTVYEKYVTAQVLLEKYDAGKSGEGYGVPPRTTVRSYLADDIARFHSPSRYMLNLAEQAWGAPVIR